MKNDFVDIALKNDQGSLETFSLFGCLGSNHIYIEIGKLYSLFQEKDSQRVKNLLQV